MQTWAIEEKRESESTKGLTKENILGRRKMEADETTMMRQWGGGHDGRELGART